MTFRIAWAALVAVASFCCATCTSAGVIHSPWYST